MDFKSISGPIIDTLQRQLPSILGAIAILVLGWIGALVVRALVRRALHMARLNERVRSASDISLDVERGVAKAAFWVILVLAFIGFFNVLNLGLVSEPLQSLVDVVFSYLPRVAAGGVLLLVAWILATVLKRLTTRALASTRMDEKLSSEAGVPPLSGSLGNVVYWLVFLLFLPAVLGALGLQGMLQPIQGMIDQIVGLIPNLLAAAVIGVVGWLVARLLRDLVTNLLSVTGLDRLGQRAGFSEAMPLSKLVGLLVYVFIFVPALIAALDALKLEVVSQPATQMLGTLMDAIPNLFAATVILMVAYYVSRFIADVLANLLEGLGFDQLPDKIGVRALFSGETKPSGFAGKLVVFFAMVFATVEAANQLGFIQISELVEDFLAFGAQVLLGTVVIAVGLWIANVVHGAILTVGGKSSTIFAGLARYTILGLVFAMGLRAMGIADDIVNLAFGLTLGAVAVAVALSFGLGGRKAAGKQMELWLSRLRGEQ